MEIASALFETPLHLDQISIARHCFCYWLSKQTGEISILELDEFGYYALSLVDGTRSIAELSCMMGGGNRPTEGFLQSMTQLTETGILDFEQSPR